MRALAHQCFGPLVTQEACATTGSSLILVGVVLLSWTGFIKNSLFGCSGSGSAVLAIGSGSGFRVYPILDPSPTPKNPNPEIYPDEIFFKDFSVTAVVSRCLKARREDEDASRGRHGGYESRV